MASSSTTAPPRLTTLVLPELEEGDSALLNPHALVEGRRFTGEWEGVDLVDAELSECLLERVVLVEAALRGVRIVDTRISVLNAPVLPASRSTWRDVVIEQSRIGSGEFYDSELRAVAITHSKLGYINLRGSKLTDVRIADNTIDELDLGGVTAQRLAVRDCQIGILDVTGSRFTDVDLRGSTFHEIHGMTGLRGVTIDEHQLAELAPLLAAEAGIRVH